MNLAYSLSMLFFLDSASAHGYMKSPKIRGSSDYNKNGFWAKVDENHNRCPGFGVKKYGNEPNSKFSPKQAYKAGGNIDIELYLTALHPGPIWIEYACMDGHENESVDTARVTWTKLSLDDGSTEIKSGLCISNSAIAACSSGACTCKFPVKAPVANCNHGVLASNWHNIGGIPNEVFKHCADIGITDGSNLPAKTPSVGSNSPSANPSVGSNSPSANPSAGSNSPSSNPSVGSNSPSANPSAGSNSPSANPSAGSPSAASNEHPRDSGNWITILIILGCCTLAGLAITCGAYYCYVKGKVDKPSPPVHRTAQLSGTHRHRPACKRK